MKYSDLVLVHDALGMCTWRWDVVRDEVEWIGDASPLLGLARGSFSGRFADYVERLHPQDRERSRRTYAECLKGVRPTYRTEERVIWPSGAVRWLETYGRGSYDRQGRAVELVGVVRDVTERKQAEEKYVAVFAASLEAIAIARRGDSVLLEVNDAWVAATGFSRDFAIGRAAMDLRLWQTPAQRTEVFATIDEKGLLRNFPTRFVRADGRVIDVLLSGVMVQLDSGVCVVWSWSDITPRKEADARIQYLITHDVLTGLPTRSLLLDRVGHALAGVRGLQQTLAVLVVDLDRFRSINDSLGPHIGDALLKAVALRLATSVRKGDTIARLAGDVFVVVLEDVDSPAAAVRSAQKMREALAEPFSVEEHQLTITACIGIAVHPDDGDDAHTLLRNADAAMHHAKQLGRNSLQFFSRDLNARALARLRLELELRRALRSEDFYLEFQPVFNAGESRPDGAEALLRWRHAERGGVSPATFVPVMEDMGIISEVGDWVLDRSLRQLAEWRACGDSELRVAVNISARQLALGVPFAQRVMALLAEHRIPAHLLELEITETSLARDIEQLSAVLAKLAAHGVKLAIDDFGTGYSSMAYLQRLPLHTLKIDGGFVRDIERAAANRTLVRTMIGMAHTLGLRTVAEGIETRRQLEILLDMGCDACQGYLLSPPLKPAQLKRRFFDSATIPRAG